MRRTSNHGRDDPLRSPESHRTVPTMRLRMNFIQHRRAGARSCRKHPLCTIHTAGDKPPPYGDMDYPHERCAPTILLRMNLQCVPISVCYIPTDGRFMNRPYKQINGGFCIVQRLRVNDAIFFYKMICGADLPNLFSFHFSLFTHNSCFPSINLSNSP